MIAVLKEPSLSDYGFELLESAHGAITTPLGRTKKLHLEAIRTRSKHKTRETLPREYGIKRGKEIYGAD